LPRIELELRNAIMRELSLFGGAKAFMSSDTISVMTFTESESTSVLDKPGGGKGSVSTVPGWNREAGIVGDSWPEAIGMSFLVRRDVPMERIECEFQKLIGLMNRLFSQTEQPPELKSLEDQKRLRLNEVSLTVEINAEGGLSILGTGGKLGGKGGMTLKFTKD
jgi:hypothetical protein